MLVKQIFAMGLVFSISLTPAAFAGKTELTAYYPSTNGEFVNLKSSADSYFATTSGNVGIGTTTSTAKLQVYGNGNGTTPATSGTTDVTMNLQAGRGNASVDVGMLDSGTGYIQSRRIPDFSTNYNLSLQPNGGSVGIGTTSPVGKLDVRGSLASTGWTAVSFGTGWSNYAGLFQTVQYKKFGDFVYLRGLANTASAWTTYPTITTLPVGFRPASGTQIFHVMGNANQIVRVDVQTSGVVTYNGGGANTGWLCLDGISFSVD